MSFPQKIEFLSDGNVIQLTRTQLELKSKTSSAVYTYIKSETKLNRELTVTEQQINRLLSDNLIKILNNGTERDQKNEGGSKGEGGNPTAQKETPNSKGVKKTGSSAAKRKK